MPLHSIAWRGWLAAFCNVRHCALVQVGGTISGKPGLEDDRKSLKQLSFQVQCFAMVYTPLDSAARQHSVQLVSNVTGLVVYVPEQMLMSCIEWNVAYCYACVCNICIS